MNLDEKKSIQDPQENIPKALLEIVDYVIEYVDGNSNDWFQIKTEIVNMFPPKERSRFSRRHYSSDKHILNSFDKAIINYWEKKTGDKIWVNPDKLHPKDWNPKPRGWGLQRFNEKRTKAKKANSEESDQ